MSLFAELKRRNVFRVGIAPATARASVETNLFFRLSIALLALSIFTLCRSATACSLSPGSFIQSNFEMIDTSDAIVVARALRKKTGDSSSTRIIFKVEEILKGSPSAEVFDISAHFGKPTPSDPKNILSANPEAFRGSCNRFTYRRGDKYVLMLRNEPGYGLIVSGDAFSRINEDDFGPDSMWRRAINTYMEIQKIPDRMAQLEEMQKFVHAGLGDDATEFDKQLGADALNHLLSVHPEKPTAWLIQQYEDPDFFSRKFSDLIQGTPEESADSMMSLVFGDKSSPEDEKTKILRALSAGNHPDAEPIFRSILAEISPAPTRLGAALSFFVRQKEYETVKRAFGEHILWVSAVTGPGSGPGFWGAMEPSIGYGKDLHVSDEFADWWRRQELAACLLASGPFGCNYDWDKAAALLDAPRNNQTLLLAGASSPDVITWAENELDRLQAAGIETHKDEWDFPLKLLLAAYRGDGPKRVHSLACGSESMRAGLAELIGEVPTLYTRQLLREMMSIEQHDHVRERLFESAVLIAAHEMEKSWLGDADLPYAYARADGKLALEKDEDRHLPCLD